MHLPDRFVRFFFGFSLILVGLPSIEVLAQANDDQPDPEDLVPGLILEWFPRDHDHPRLIHIASTIVDQWGETVPDPRLPIEGFRTFWSGWLLIRASGDVRFRIDSDGPVRLEIGERSIASEGGTPFISEPISMRPGLVPIRLRSEHQGPDRRIVVDWEGPNFGWEHLPPSQLFHEAINTPNEDAFEQGRRLADQLGCANCHSMTGVAAHPNLGPSLSQVHSIQPGWLLDWITDPQTRRPGTPMPGFRLDDQQAIDVVAALHSLAENPAAPDRETRMAVNVADPDRGRLLFRSAGCLGCHPQGREDHSDRIQFVPHLEGLAAKRTLESVAMMLAGPSRSQPGRHRPELGLSTDAAAHLAAYFTSTETDRDDDAEVPLPEGDPQRGWALIDAIGCRSCHEIPGAAILKSAVPLNQKTNLQQGCLSEDPPFGVPRYGFDEVQRRSIRTFLAGSSPNSAPQSAWTRAQDALRRHNCLGCHSRDGQGGERFGEQLARFLAKDKELNSLKGTLTPPDLSQVGAKLLPESLDLAVRGEAPTARPWLSVRMPRFAFEPGEAEAIAAYLREFDQVVLEQPAEQKALTLRADVGFTLLGRQGFGCVSCHVLDGKIPPGGEAETLGPDLALAHRRMSKTYFDRWLSDPQRIIPGTAMPQFLLPAPGVEGTIQEQLGAVWNALGDPNLVEFTSTSVREFLVRQGDRAQVVRDMIVPEDTPRSYYPRGLAIGFKGDRSILFDSNRLSWIRWWDEGFLSRTKEGRLWEWHPEGQNLWVAQEELPPVLLRQADDKLLIPELRRDRFGSFKELTFEGNGVRLRYELNVPEQSSVQVTELLDPTEDGWRRQVRVENVPDGMTPEILAVTGESWTVSEAQRATNRMSRLIMRIEHPGARMKAISDPMLRHSILVEPEALGKGIWSGTLRVVVRPKQ